MNEIKENLIEGARRFIMWNWNYESLCNDTDGKWYPDVLLKCEWHCDRQHLCGKWNRYNEDRGNITELANLDFYANLDQENRNAMLEWIIENYK